jgi:signal transduction histidine kinase
LAAGVDMAEAQFTASAHLRDRFAAARAADAAELEQAILRVSIVPLVEAYFAAAFLWDRVLDDGELAILGIVAAAFALGVAHLGWVLVRPGVHHLRRRAGAALDVGTITAAMLLAGDSGAPLYALYLGVVIGNGFRFGRWYLHYAQILALAGFGAVLAFGGSWSGHTALSAALVLVLVAIPWYVSLFVIRLRRAAHRLQAAHGHAEAASVAKTKFLAAASHDLRQPMQALSMYASVLEARLGGSEALGVVHGIQLSVRTLEQMFDSLLDIARIESGVIKPNVVAFPLQPLIEQVVAAEKPIAARKQLELRVMRCSASVRSDPVLLERMLKNLVTNAIRYTERGRIIVGCRRLRGERLRLEVVDSGIGIPTAEQKRIFDEYYQLGSPGTQGLGLGLPIVKALGELLGHAVAVRSAPGRGSAFSIELERALVAAAPEAPSPGPHAPLSGTRVVLVDDDAEIRHSMRLLLEGWGCRIIAGANAAEVEEKLRSQGVRPDALIVDYRLAEAMTGLQVLDRLRRVFGPVPALVITGTPSAVPRRELGATPIATKPVPPGKLRAFLSQARRNAT